MGVGCCTLFTTETENVVYFSQLSRQTVRNSWAPIYMYDSLFCRIIVKVYMPLGWFFVTIRNPPSFLLFPALSQTEIFRHLIIWYLSIAR